MFSKCCCESPSSGVNEQNVVQPAFVLVLKKTARLMEVHQMVLPLPVAMRKRQLVQIFVR